MSDVGKIYLNKHLEYKTSYYGQEISPCDGIQNVSIIVHKKHNKKRKINKTFEAQKPRNAHYLSSSSSFKILRTVTKRSSMPEIYKCKKLAQSCARSMHAIKKQNEHPFKSKFIVNVVSEHRFDPCLNPFNYPSQTKWKIYRCQLNSHDDSCCCSCNSDAMFEVMKSLYDCYKKKNCDNCDCILCGHLQREERQLGEMRKSAGVVGMDTASAKERKEKIKKAEKALEGKSPAEKEKVLREMAKTRQPLPDGKTPSEKALVQKIRNELGLPPEPKTAEEKIKMRKAEAAGIITPLEGKTAAQKEKILKAQAALGIPLPEGRTPSEKALIQKVQAAAGIPVGVPSAKLRKARAAGLITPLEGKTPEQKEKILKGLAMHGIALPEGTTPSEKKLIDKVRADMGLPPEPKTKAMRNRYANAANAGLLQPLEGKSPREKERILQGLADLGIPLPEGRTPSEKSLVAKVKARAGPPLDITAPSEKIRRAKAAGLLTPLAGKTPEQREKILRGLAMQGIPLPEGQTPSERKLIDKVRADLGLPPEPKSKAIRDKHEAAANIGLLQPLEGKTPAQKEKILQGLHDMDIPLPEGRTPSEKSLIAKIKAGPRALSAILAPSEKMRRAKAEGLLTPLKGKTPAQKEKILKGLAKHGIPFPEGQTPSEKQLMDKVRADVGLPPEPSTPEMRDKYAKAADQGLMQPLEGKTPKEKERILQGLHDMGIPLPEGRSPSEKALIAKVKARPRAPSAVIKPSERIRRAKAAGLITPLEGKTPEQKQKILTGLAMHGLPFPEGKTPSEKKLIDKVRADLGLSPEPTTPEMRDKYAKAADAGLLQPLEGKTPAQKEKILQGLHDMGIPLPEGRTPSEKSLIAKVKARPRILAPSEKMRRAKAEGLITPLTGKTPAQKEKILKGLAKHGLPLPEAKSPSEKQLIDKIRADLGLPPEPKTPGMRDKYAKAADAGLMQPLEGKSPKEKERILQGLHDMGIPLPEGRTPSEKALVAQVKARPRAPSAVLKPSERMRRAKAEGLLTPLTGKTPAQKEKILKGLAKHGLPLPEAKTPSEKQLIDKIRADLGLPPEPKTPEMRDKFAKAADAGLMQPLEGKSPKEKERILQGLHDMGIPLPEGRTPSEKALVAQVKARPRAPSAVLKPSERMRRAKAEGLITPLTGKTPAQKEKILKGLAKHGLPLPEAKTPSEKQLIDKIRADLGLPPEPKTPEMRDKFAKAADAGLMQPLEGKSPQEKERILQGLHDMGIPLPVGRTPSEKALVAKVKARPRAPSAVLKPSERMRRAKAEGLVTPLAGKTPAQKEKILKGLAKHGLPLPEAKTPSEKQLIDKIRADLGLPPEPKTPEMRDKFAKAADAGLMQPLEGKSPKEKERILQGLHDMGIPLPEGRTPSEKALVAQVKARPRAPSAVLKPSERMRRAKAEGFVTPLTGKTPAQKEKILKGLAKHGLPLPEAKTPSEKQLIDKIRADLGLPPEPKTPEMRDKFAKAADAGLMQPLEGKSPQEKERILQGLHDMGIPLPEGRTPSEKALVSKVKARPRAPPAVLKPSERMRRAKAEGFVTPLTGKTPAQKEKILKGLAKHGLPLPEAKTPSEKQLIDKIRADLGLPPEPKTPEMRDKFAKAADAGLMQPLEGKSPQEKERILQGLHDMGIPLPEGRTPSEKALVAKVKARPRAPSAVLKPSERMRRAKAEGLVTPLAGKTPAQKEKILKGLAKHGLPLPEAKTPSEKQLIDKIRADLGLPPEPSTPEMRDKFAKAADAGLMQPLEGKSPKEKERILQGLHDMGIPLPEGRTPSEKALVAQVKARPRAPSALLKPSERMRRAKAEGLVTPLTGKTPAQKEKILKGLAKHGLPLPEAKTPSEKQLIDKIRADLGLPPEPKTPEMKDKYAKAADAGLMQPLEGKSPKEKERILQGLHDMGIPLPEGRTPSEKALVAQVKARPRAPSALLKPSERMRRAKVEGLLTPLKGKSPAQKEKILKGLAKHGLPLPEAKTPSEKQLIDKIRADLGLPPEPATPEMRDKFAKAAEAGLMQPLEGKTPKEKERILQGLHDMGIPLPEGRTPSEKALVAQVKARPRAPSALLKPSEKMRRAKVEGLLTPLSGKTPAQKEKILKGLAKHGLPLPEAKTPSEKQLIDKIRADLGLPPEPSTPEMRDKYAKAADAGLMQPLEGKSPNEKERILQGLHDMGIPLPEGRTPSERALVAQVKARPRAPSAVLKPSERMRRAKAAGLLTPLEGKTPEQKEKILKGLATHGLPLPEGKTASEKKLIDKVRSELGLPPEPKTPSLREKYANALADGLITPLEGKSPAQKEKILRAQAARGLPLPQGRTPSEKALIAKIKSEPTPSITTDKLRKAKAAGLITPLAGKTPEQREKILKGLAKAGLPLPEGKTPSEKALINEIKKEFGIPERTPSEKLRKALAAGLLTPLEGKTPMQQEKILRGRAAAGLPLPEGRSPSERALIQKIKDDTGLVTPSPSERLRKAKAAGLLTPLKGKTPSIKEKIIKNMLAAGVPIPEGDTPSEKEMIRKLTAEPTPPKSQSEKMREAKAAGLLTPLQGKTPEQKRKILSGLVKAGLPLPEPKTESEKNLIAKIREETGLPPEPKTPSLKEKYKKAQAAGIITPLEGKTPAEKEKILKGLYDAGIPLPEGRTPSEKSMIKRVKSGMVQRKTPSEKLKEAKAAGLLTPLEGKTPVQKEKILRGLAKTGVPLPEGKTPSEVDLINKIRTEMGLPPEPKTPSLREKMHKAHAAGIITPLEGKTPIQKQKILSALAEAGIPLPEGRTPSEKSLISKIKAKAKSGKIPSEKIRKAKADGLLTPLEGKTPEEKEKIMRGLAEHGLPLPEAKTPSEKKLAAKIRKELGLPPTPKTPSMKDRHERAAAAGVLVPLEGLTPAEKERVLRAQADLGLPLPEGRTPSEKSLIAKVKAESKAPTKIPSEKLRKAKAAGLLTPLEGKSPEEKERIMRGLAEQGLPLPEAKTASEKKLAAKIRKDLGLPPAPKTLSMKERHDKAAAAGILVPLEGLSPAEKEKVLRAQAELGLPLPEGRTPSEKSLIAKVRAEQGPSKISSEKLRKAKAAGLLTPLEGKTPAEQEKIIRGLAEAGLPLPEGKTPSEKSLIHKIRTELGVPPPAMTPSEKSVVRKAKAEGLFTPITGKSPDEKERILRGLAEAGLPLPVGKTSSEKELIKKVRAETGLPPEPTPSEKMGKIKTKSKKVGITASKKLGMGIEAEEFEDIIKTTTCDRGCGCDKKKIRFKHSYVKIRVTSPDISSLCSCPEECIPGVRGGAFIDNEGIKVTVGRVIGVPSYPRDYSNYVTLDKIISNKDRCNMSTKLLKSYLYNTSKISLYKKCSPESSVSSDKVDYIFDTSGSGVSRSGSRPISWASCNQLLQNSTPPYEGRISKSERLVNHSSVDICNDPALRNNSSCFSFHSILVIKSQTSLSLTTSVSDDMDSMGVTSAAENSISSNCMQYPRYQFTDGTSSFSSIERPKSRKRMDCNSNGTITSSDNKMYNPTLIRKRNVKTKINAAATNKKQDEYMIFRMSQAKFNAIKDRSKRNATRRDPFVIINQLTKKLDITTMVDKLLSKKEYSGASSIFIVVPTSDDNDAESSSNDCNSNESIQSTKKDDNGINTIPVEPKPRRSTAKCEAKVCGKGKKFYMQEIKFSFHDKETRFNNEPFKVFRHKDNTRNKLCQINTPNATVQKSKERSNVVTTDTTMDRPCCCFRKQTESIQDTGSKGQYVATVMSSQNTSSYFQQGKQPQESYLSLRSTSSPVLKCNIPEASPSISYDSKSILKNTMPKYGKRHTYGLLHPPDRNEHPQESYLSIRLSQSPVSACNIPESSAYSSFISKQIHKHNGSKYDYKRRSYLLHSPDRNKRPQESYLSTKPSRSSGSGCDIPVSSAQSSYYKSKLMHKHTAPKHAYKGYSYGSLRSPDINERQQESYLSIRQSPSPVSACDIPRDPPRSNYHNFKSYQKNSMPKYDYKRRNDELLHSPDLKKLPQVSHTCIRSPPPGFSYDTPVSSVQNSYNPIKKNLVPIHGHNNDLLHRPNTQLNKRPQESYLSLKALASAYNIPMSSVDSSCNNSTHLIHEHHVPKHANEPYKYLQATQPCHCDGRQLKALLELATRAGISLDKQSFECISAGKDSITINTATASIGDCNACFEDVSCAKEEELEEMRPSKRKINEPKYEMKSKGIVTELKGSDIISGSSGSKQHVKSKHKKTRFRKASKDPVITSSRSSLNTLPDQTESHDSAIILPKKNTASQQSGPKKSVKKKISALLTKFSFSRIGCKCEEKDPDEKPVEKIIENPDNILHQTESGRSKNRKLESLAVQTEPVHIEPKSNHPEPESIHTQPKNHTEPKSILAKAKDSEPKVTHVKPESKQSEPESDNTEPKSSHTEPESDHRVAKSNKMVAENNTAHPTNNTTIPGNNKLIPNNNKTIPEISKNQVPESDKTKLLDEVRPKAEEIPQVTSSQLKLPAIFRKASLKKIKFLNAIGKGLEGPKTKMDCECTQGGKAICKCHDVISAAEGTVKKTCGCIEVPGEKVTCECYPKPTKITRSTSGPKLAPEFQLVPGQNLGQAQYEFMEFPYGPSCGWIDTGEIMKMRSEMTLTTSGFKLQQKKRQQIIAENIAREGPEIELDFEDAIRYYASLNPQKFRELMQNTLEEEGKKKGKKKGKEKKKKKDKGKKKDEKKNKGKEKKKGKGIETSTDEETDTSGSSEAETQSGANCKCPYGPIPSPISYDTTTSESGLEGGRITGLKFSIGGKGSASCRDLFCRRD